MKFIDLHCDTVMHMTENEKISLFKNNLSIDIQKLKEGNCLAQTFALFVALNEQNNPFEYCVKMGKKFFEQIKENEEHIGFVKNYEDIMKNDSKNKLSALLAIEEGGVIEGKMENLQYFYDLGVRMITLTWNHKNEIGYPNAKEEYRNLGLTEFGVDVVKKMNELGMIIDVSHLSDGGFYDVAKYSTKPFIASHSNARTITNHVRNLTDDMLKVLANSGGITGINFYSSFLGSKGEGKIEDMIYHIKHIKNIAGIDVISLGSDFDGINTPVEIKDASQMNKLELALRKEKFTEDEIEKIFYKNALRVIKETL